MKRVVIPGCGGSGKSHVAQRLSDVLNIPVINLDALYDDGEWNVLTPNKFAALQHDLAAAPSWIIDGNYATTLPIRLAEADAVVLLDISTVMCLWGIATRRLRQWGSLEKSPGVYGRITWSFVRYVFAYRRVMRPRVQQLMTQHATHAESVVLTNRRSIREWLDQMGSLNTAMRRPAAKSDPRRNRQGSVTA